MYTNKGEKTNLFLTEIHCPCRYSGAENMRRVVINTCFEDAGLPDNEMADEVARAAADLSQGQEPVDLHSAKSRLKRHAHREWKE